MDPLDTPCPGLLSAWRLVPHGAPRRLDAAEAGAAIATDPAGLWLHLDLVDLRSRAVIARLPLPAPARAALAEPDESPHLDLAQGALFGAVPDFVFESAEADPDAAMALLHVALTPTLLVTARRHPLRAVHAVAQDPDCGLPAEALAAILARTAESLGRSLASLSDRLVRLEERLLRADLEGRRAPLASLRRRTLHIERRFAPAALALQALVEEAEDAPEAEFARPVFRVARRHAALLQAIAALKERGRIAQDEMANLAAEETNRRLFVLSVISAAMLPASLVAGIFGMNVGSVPGVDQEWGFVMAMGLIGGSILGILGLLRLWRLL